MAGVGERRHANPRRPLAAHLGEQFGVAVHPLRHVMTADAGEADAAIGHPGGGVVRAAGAEIGRAAERRRCARAALFFGVEELQPAANGGAVVELRDAPADSARHRRRSQLAEVRHQLAPVLVKLAHHLRALRHRQVIQLRGDLALHHAALFLHHHNLVKPGGEASSGDRLQRPVHPHLVDANADVGGGRRVDAEVIQRFQHIEMRLAGGDDAKPRAGAIVGHAVQVVGEGKGARRGDAVFVQQPLLLRRGRGPLRIQPARREREIIRQADVDAPGGEVGRDGRVHRLGNRLQPNPATAVSRQRPAIKPIVQHFLDIGGVQHRHRGRDEVMLALMRQGGRLAGVVITGHRQHAAVASRAICIGVLQHIHAAVNPGPLAIPQRKHAIVFCPRQQMRLLRPPHRGRRQVLVDPRLKVNVMRFKPRRRLPQRLVQRAHRRAAITGHKPGGVQPGLHIPPALQHRQPHQRLNAAHKSASRIRRVFVIEGYFVRHAGGIPHRWRFGAGGRAGKTAAPMG